MSADSQRKVTDRQLIESIAKRGIGRTARHFKMTERQIFRRRREIESKQDRPISSPVGPNGHMVRQRQEEPHRIHLTVPNGVVIVAGDAHYWPGQAPFMHKALVHFLKRFREERKLRAVIMNGDVTDFAAISRWPLVNWEKQPLPKDEIETAQEMMHEIADAAGKVEKLWPGGNHDMRFNMFLAAKAPEMAGVQGTHLKDHFPLWRACWSVLINENTFIKHRLRGGINAVRNNVLATGLHTITNHLHSAQVTPITNMNGTLYGVDTGCIAEVNAPQFLYTEDNPKNWREAFCVLTYHDGELLPPELVQRFDAKPDCVTFRGEVIKI